MPNWEYKTIQAPFSTGWSKPSLDSTAFDDFLNRLGSEGWELVSVFTTNLENGRSGEVIAAFKRICKE